MRRILWMTVAFFSCALQAIAQDEELFRNPPTEMCSHVILGWDGIINQQVINDDLDSIQAKGFRNIIIEPGYHMGIEYLSDQWFENVRMMADAVSKRGMKMWIIDEGKYPSGMAGGWFSKKRPDLCMQALVSHGDTVTAVRRSSQTRCVNNPTGGKDENNSLCDYLDSTAVRQFIAWTHEQYKEWLGSHLGTTVMGFRGDEPAFQRVPYTNGIMELFKEQKGYDPTPYLNAFVRNQRISLHDDKATEQERRAKADYWDVWSRLFADHYFKQQADWCEANGVQHITHMDKDDMLPWCVKMEGDPFRVLSRVQIPGIDVIWSQIWPGCQTEFPRLASSVAHVYGKQRAFSESFAAYSHPLDIPHVKYIVDYQLARGINFFEFMFWMSKRGATSYMAQPGMKELNDYVNRATYILSQGKPACRVAVYAPIPTLWLGNNQGDEMMKAIEHLLTAHQYDYDLITDDGLSEACTVGNGVLRNRSGQDYHTLIIPTTEVMTAQAWQKITDFIGRGGKLIFWGERPRGMIHRSFMEEAAIQLPTSALHLTDSVWDQRIIPFLPQRDMEIVEGEPDGISYTARQQNNRKVYFLFNQQENGKSLTIDFDVMGEAQLWDAATGNIQVIDSKVVNNKTRVSLNLEGWGSRIIVITKRTNRYVIKNQGNIQQVIDQAHADGGGTVVIPKGTFRTGALFFPRGVDLHLEKGARLVSLVDTTLYPIITTRWEGQMKRARAALLNFNDNENCCLTGEGVIDAQGLEWRKIPFNQYGKPKTICFNGCHGGSIQGVRILNQAFWCLHILFTRGFTVDGIQICAEDYIPSSDGIDVDSSTDIIIKNTHIKAHDDCISIKSGKDEDGRAMNLPAENILIEDCHFDYGHGGVAMGSEVSGGIRNVTVRRCNMTGENWNPIRFKSQPSRGGFVENILFEDIHISQARNILEVNMIWRMKGDVKPPHYPLTKLRNICFRNIEGTAENAGSIIGFPEQPFSKDVFHFENCRLHVKNPLKVENANLDTDGLVVELLNP